MAMIYFLLSFSYCLCLLVLSEGVLNQGNNSPAGNELSSRMKSKRFVSWLERSGILNDLREKKEQYTVITPTDEAISKLPQQILLALELNPKGLKSLLKYHVVKGKVDLKNMKDGEKLKSSDKKDIQVNLIGDTRSSLGGAVVINEYTDSQINYITVDKVLYPPQGSVYQIISGSPLLTNFTQIIKTANLIKEFSETEPLTVLAPTDDAFKSLNFNELVKITRDPKSARGK